MCIKIKQNGFKCCVIIYICSIFKIKYHTFEIQSMIKAEVIVQEQKTPLLNRIVFSTFSAGVLTFLVYVFSKRKEFDFVVQANIFTYSIFLVFILFFYFTPLITSQEIHLNFTELKIKYVYNVGVFKWNRRWKKLKEPDYLSVFHTENGYELNLWYKKNKVLSLFAIEDFDDVIKQGIFLSEKMNIDLLDARKRGYHKWVNKTVYKETGEIEYLD